MEALAHITIIAVYLNTKHKQYEKGTEKEQLKLPLVSLTCRYELSSNKFLF